MLTYSDYHYDGNYRFDYAEEGRPPELISQIDVASGRWWGTEVQLDARPLRRLTLIGGLQTRHNVQQDQLNEDRYDSDGHGANNLDDHRRSFIWSSYAQGEIKVFEPLKLSAGLRLDYYDTFGSTLNPRASIVYNPFKNSALKLLYGEAFRAANAYEQYYHDGGISSKPAQQLRPETIRTLELVWSSFSSIAFGLPAHSSSIKRDP